MKVRITKAEILDALSRDYGFKFYGTTPETLELEAEAIEECEQGHGPWAYHKIRPERRCMTCDVVEAWPSANSDKVEEKSDEELLANLIDKLWCDSFDTYPEHLKSSFRETQADRLKRQKIIIKFFLSHNAINPEFLEKLRGEV